MYTHWFGNARNLIRIIPKIKSSLSNDDHTITTHRYSNKHKSSHICIYLPLTLPKHKHTWTLRMCLIRLQTKHKLHATYLWSEITLARNYSLKLAHHSRWSIFQRNRHHHRAPMTHFTLYILRQNHNHPSSDGKQCEFDISYTRTSTQTAHTHHIYGLGNIVCVIWHTSVYIYTTITQQIISHSQNLQGWRIIRYIYILLLFFTTTVYELWNTTNKRWFNEDQIQINSNKTKSKFHY